MLSGGEARAHAEIELAAADQERHVDVGSAALELDIEASLLINPPGLGLEEAAMLALGQPIQPEADFFRGPR